jgi:hypothetical protein
MDEEARQRGAAWADSKYWHWVDAAAWAATRRPRLMALLAGYRDLRTRHQPQVSEGASRTVLVQHVPAARVDRAERDLRAWCVSGALEALSVSTGEALSVADWVRKQVPAQAD